MCVGACWINGECVWGVGLMESVCGCDVLFCNTRWIIHLPQHFEDGF